MQYCLRLGRIKINHRLKADDGKATRLYCLQATAGQEASLATLHEDSCGERLQIQTENVELT